MGVFSRLWLAGVSAAVLAAAAPASAAPDTSAWAGIWDHIGSYNFDTSIPMSRHDQPPYTPKYAAEAQAVLDAEKSGKPIEDVGAECIPRGLILLMGNPYPLEIIPGPKQITMINEYLTQVRRIYIDGRKHQEDPDPNYNGDSIGHWEGDVLVVDTVGLKDTLSLTAGLPLGAHLHITERMYLKDENTFNDEITMEGDAFTHPYTSTKSFRRNTKTSMMEYTCAENNRNPISASGITGIILQSGRK